MDAAHLYLLDNSQAVYKEPAEFQQEISSLNEPVFFTTLVTSAIPPGAFVPTLFKLDWHLERLFSSTLSLNQSSLNQSSSSAHALVLHTLRQYYQGQYYQENTERGTERENIQLRLRLMVVRHELYFSIEPYQPIWSPGSSILAVTYSGSRQNPGQKILSDKTSLQAREYAVSQGTQEAFFVDKDGFLREGAWSNIFWVDQEQKLWTPKTQILPGITRRALLEHCPLAPTARDVLWNDVLTSAKEIFITQSTSGITPIIACDGQVIGRGAVGPMTLQVIDWYQQATTEVMTIEEENEIKA